LLQVPDKQEPLTLEEAIEVFDQLADMDDIAFGYSSDGCYARAHIMCRRMIEAGLNPGKAWAFEGAEHLTVNKPDGSKARWWFHVASALNVKMLDGNVQRLVFDPGLFDGPVTLEEWGETINAEPDKLQMVDFGVAPQGFPGDYGPYQKTDKDTDKVAALRMKEYLDYQDKGTRIVFASQNRQQIINQSISQQQTPDDSPHITEVFQQSQKVPGLQGRTWISATLHQQQSANASTKKISGGLSLTDQFETASSPYDAGSLGTTIKNGLDWLGTLKNKTQELHT